MEQVRGHALRDSGYKAAYDDYWTLMHDISDTNRDGKLSRYVIIFCHPIGNINKNNFMDE